MVSDSPAALFGAQAARLGATLGAIEAALDGAPAGVDPDTLAAALAEPVRALGEAAREALR